MFACSDLLGETAWLAHSHQRSPHLHQWQPLQGSLQGGILQLGPPGTVFGSRTAHLHQWQPLQGPLSSTPHLVQQTRKGQILCSLVLVSRFGLRVLLHIPPDMSFVLFVQRLPVPHNQVLSGCTKLFVKTHIAGCHLKPRSEKEGKNRSRRL